MYHKRNALYLFVILICFLTNLNLTRAAETEETYFKFTVKARVELETITRLISIDKVIGDTVYAYANQQQIEVFENLNYLYQKLPHPGTLIQPEMTTDPAEVKGWDVYPTYDAYVSLMNQFASGYPNLCQLVNIGSSVEGRSLLFVKISDNVDQAEDEPEFMYTATMHGDETCGFMLMLRLIDYLLSNYGVDTQVTELVNNSEIWINPLANPDGTYNSGNHTVYGATRYNANGVDLNRNFKEPDEGDHPDGNAWQPETIAMMDFAADHHFVHSANFHGGAEVVNYPWDTWPDLHADDDWYQDISHEYADLAQANSPYGYMDGFDDGITNGWDWYTVAGGRQDFMNYFQRCRETTIELSNTKLLPESELNNHWNYNKDALLNYMDNVLSGIRGIVTDMYGNPLAAEITLVDHDFTNSQVWTDPAVGDYHRMVVAGNYILMVDAYGYSPKIIENIDITNDKSTIVNIELEELPEDLNPILVFDRDRNVNSSFYIQKSLENLNQVVNYRSSLPPGSIERYAAIFICLGIYNKNANITPTEANKLINYLDNGGCLYLEGGDFWYDSGVTCLNSYFGINPLGDGYGNTDGVTGCDSSFMQDIAFNYYGDNSYMDSLLAVGTAFPIFYNQNPFYYNGIANQTANYKTVGLSFEFGGIPNTWQDSVMYRYLSYFDIDTSLAPDYILGDVNQDDMINVVDIVKVVSFILQTITPNEQEILAADYNADGTLTVNDIMSIVAYILNSGNKLGS